MWQSLGQYISPERGCNLVVHTLGKHRSVLLTSLLLIVILILISSNVGKERNFNPLQTIIIEGLSPLEKAIVTSKNSVIDLWNKYIYLINVRKENQALKRMINKLKEENNQYREAIMANIRLEKLLDFKEKVPAPMVPAQVVGWDPSTWFRTIIIDKGIRDGIEPNMPVVNSDGIIGRIMQTSSHYSKVLLIIDPNSAIDSIVQRTRARGILEGTGGGDCELKYFSKNDDVREGDRIVSSGLGGIFPKGLALGEVTKVKRGNSEMFQHVKVRSSVDFTKLEEVLVILRKPTSLN